MVLVDEADRLTRLTKLIYVIFFVLCLLSVSTPERAWASDPQIFLNESNFIVLVRYSNHCKQHTNLYS